MQAGRPCLDRHRGDESHERNVDQRPIAQEFGARSIQLSFMA